MPVLANVRETRLEWSVLPIVLAVLVELICALKNVISMLVSVKKVTVIKMLASKSVFLNLNVHDCK
jgi:hypothetical protein